MILITIDSLRADHLGCYGYGPPTSPALDAFAREGVLFRHAYAASPWTLPSHASLFTGLYEDTHGIGEENVALKKSAPTLAARLAGAGYRTGAVVCAPLLRRVFGLDAGFEDYDTELIAKTFVQARLVKVGPSVTKKALDWLDHGDGRPFFLFLHYWDVHYDYNPPKEYADLFDPGYEGKIDGIDIYNRTDIVPGMDPRDLAHLKALYDGEIRYTDDALGALLEGLKKRGLDKTTMVWITADHGGKGHTTTCYEELVRVPLLAQIPWIEPARSVMDAPASLVDLFPTILDLLEVPAGKTDLQGRSLAPLIKSGREPAPRYLMAQTRRGRIDGEGKGGTSFLWTSFLGPDRLKLHQLWRGPGKTEYLLFDIKSDPEERHDLVPKQGTTTERLARLLLQRRKEHLDKKRTLDLSAPRELDPELSRTLRGLGYGR